MQDRTRPERTTDYPRRLFSPGVMLVGALSLVTLVWISRINYLLYHGLVEVFSVAVAWSLFGIAWNTRREVSTDAWLLLGLASLSVGALDLVHTLAYKGMGVFPHHDANLPTQLWIAARYVQSLSTLAAFALLSAPRGAVIRGRWGSEIVLGGYLALTALLLWAAFSGVFPTCYVEGVGLTPFKRISEYAISLILLGAGVLLLRQQQSLDRRVRTLLLVFVGASVVAELAFTFYAGVYDVSNLIGHLFKIVAFSALYQGVVRTGLRQPHALLYNELIESRARLQGYIDHAPTGVFIADQQGRYIEINAAATEITGYSEQELLGKHISDMVPPDAQETAAAHFGRVLQEGEAAGVVPYRRKNGQIGYWSVDAVRLSPTRLMGFVSDVTEREEAHRALRESQQELQQLIESMINAFVIFESVFDEQGHFVSYRFEYINAAYERITGVTLDEVRGKTVHEVWPGTEGWWIENYGAVAMTGVPREFELYHDPTKKLYYCHVYRPWESNRRFCVVFEDITERKRAEQTLREHSQELERRVAERTRELNEAHEQLRRREQLAALGQMAGSVGHELRTPLAVIANAVAYLKIVLGDAGETVREYLGIIQGQVDNSAKIVHDLLDFGRALPTDTVNVSIADLYASVLDRNAPPEGVQVHTELPSGLPPLRADRQHVEIVLANLLSNAYQAMPEGGEVTLSARAEGDRVTLSVADTGPGISAENASKIFEPLFTTKAGGTGLGLSICKKLVEANRGQIALTNPAGEGATFAIELPADRIAPRVDTESPTASPTEG